MTTPANASRLPISGFRSEVAPRDVFDPMNLMLEFYAPTVPKSLRHIESHPASSRSCVGLANPDTDGHRRDGRCDDLPHFRVEVGKVDLVPQASAGADSLWDQGRAVGWGCPAGTGSVNVNLLLNVAMPPGRVGG